MGDNKRFRAFASIILEEFSTSDYILDVAGGGGRLNRLLSDRRVLTVDPAAKGNFWKMKQKFDLTWLHKQHAQDCDLIVGLHPDEATECIIRIAAQNHKPFVLSPCCVLPSLTSFRGNQHTWKQHLEQYARTFGFKVKTQKMACKGANHCIVGIPQ